MNNSVKNWEDLSKKEQMEFNLELGKAVMNDYRVAAEQHELNRKPCSVNHNQKEWYCDIMKDGTEVHFKKTDCVCL